MKNQVVLIAFHNGKFDTIKGENLTIEHQSPTTITINKNGKSIFIGSVQDLRYVRFKDESLKE